MKRLLLVGLLLLGAILVAGWLVLPSLLDLEAHRPAIEQAISSATGRKTSLGTLKLELFPLPRLRAQGLRIAEDEGFGSGSFLEAKQVEIRIRFWPLLKRTISVVSLTIDEPQVQVLRNAEGRWSVLTLGAAGSASPAPGSPPAAAGTPAPGRVPASGAEPGGGLSFQADEVRLSRGRLRVLDAALEKGKTRSTEIRNLDCTLRDLSLTTPVGIDLSFDLEGIGRLGLGGRVGPLSPESAGTLPLDLRFGVSGSKASVTGKLHGLHERPAIDARLVATKVALKEIFPLLRLLGPLLPAGLGAKGEITVDASVRGPLDDPARMSVEGTASVADLELQDPSLAKPITGIHGTLALKGDRARIDDFGATLGKSGVSGSCTLASFARPVLDLHLESPMLDVDELLSLLAAPASPSSPATPRDGTRAAPAAPSAVRVPAAAPVAPERSVLGDVTLSGDLGVRRAKALNLALSNAGAKLAMERGSLGLRGISVDLYGGRMSGDLKAEVVEPGPPFTLSARLDRVEFGALAADLSKDLAGLLSGTLETSLEVRGRGIDTPALRRDLTGQGSLRLRDGKLSSFGVLKMVSKALQAAGGRGIGADETPFRSLSGSFKIENGRAATEDLTLDSADIVLLGRGSVGLDLSLDLHLSARFSPAVSADMVAKTEGLKYLVDPDGRMQLDLTARGSLGAPSIGIDREMIDRAARSALKNKVREKGKSLLEKLLEKKKP